MEKTHEAITKKGSALGQYQDVIVGNKSLLFLLFFEFCQILSIIPGALGMVLRKFFWPGLFGACGKGVLFGTNIVLRHPQRIDLGKRVVISDGCILDGRSPEMETAISLGDDVILSNNVMLSCKDGSIAIGSNTGVNAQSIIQSTSSCRVNIGEDVVIGQRCFIIGGGNYNTEQRDIPIRLQGIRPDGGVNIENNVWLGGNATVLGGVRVGHGSIISASCVMTKTVEPMSICQGVPGRVVKKRN